MGLDVSHDAWHGAYSAFMKWRSKVAFVAGYPPLALMEGFYAPDAGVDPLYGVRTDAPIREELPIRWRMFPAEDPLIELLRHSDCDGEIDPENCGPIAGRLAELLPLMPFGDTPGHIGNWRATTQRFIDGLRRAAAANEPLKFR